MDLTTGYPFWLIKNGLPYTYPKLESSVQVDVAIIGGGISGALTNYYLSKAGMDCLVVDARTIGLGSTCASTSLLQYELDNSLTELSEQIGFQKASRVYQLCSDSIDTLETICLDIKFQDFDRNQSLYFAATKKDNSWLKDEFEIRKRAGFGVQLLQQKEIEKKFGFKAPSAILSEQGATMNAYMFTHALHQASIKQGASVYDRSTVTHISYKRSSVILQMKNGCQIKAKNIVNASGYEITEFIEKKIVKLHSTYALVSEQLGKKSLPWKNAVLWNTADPYLYIRQTNDNRIIVGGRDEEFFNPTKRDKMIKKKSLQLRHDFNKLFPDVEMIPEFSWTGTFG
nr:FAD-binding oxidoreductase [Bacteroidota bacterium]